MNNPDSHRSITMPTRRTLPCALGAIAVVLAATSPPAIWAAPKKKAVGNQPAVQPVVKPLTAQERDALLAELDAMGVHSKPYARFSYEMPAAEAGKLMVEIHGSQPVSEALQKLERLGSDVLELRLSPPEGQPNLGPGNFTDTDFYLIGRLAGLEILRLRGITIAAKSIEQLAGLAKLSWIEITNCDGVTNDTLWQIALCRSVTSLELGMRAGAVTAEGFAHLADLESLKRLTLRGSTVPDDVAARLARCNALESLSISGSAFSDEGLRLVADLKHLRALSVYGAKISAAGLKHLMPCHLETLVLANCPQLGDDSLEVIGQLSSLVSLAIEDIPLSDGGLKPLNQLGKLQSLVLWNNSHITGAGFASLTALHKLRFLTIKGENVSDDLFAHLHELEALENLTVGCGTKTVNAKITDEGIKSIGSMPRLYVIYFEGTAITREGLEPLAAQPELYTVILSTPGFPYYRNVPQITWHPNRKR
jgi:hypothetical protein